jgi:hypothetical protein
VGAREDRAGIAPQRTQGGGQHLHGTSLISCSGPVASLGLIGLSGNRHASRHAKGRAFVVIVSGASSGQSHGLLVGSGEA